MDPKRLFDFLAASPSCYHAVQALSDRLTQEGYTQLHEADAWTLTARSIPAFRRRTVDAARIPG